MIELSDDLLNELDLDAATATECQMSPDLLPRPLIDRAVEVDSPYFAALIADFGKAGAEVRESDVVWASKWHYGKRPIAVMPLHERVLYRATVATLTDMLPLSSRRSENYQEFQQGPISSPDSHFVVTTDLANYYSTIRADRMAAALMRRTGRWGPIRWLREFWLTTSGGLDGIPQGHWASDMVAETYADDLHRNIARRGLDSWRYVDDFRMPARNWPRAVEALEVFTEESHALGLFVNERKTLIMRMAKYEESLDVQERRLAQIQGEVAQELFFFGNYRDEPIKPEEAELLRQTAVRVLEYWRTKRSVSGHYDAILAVETAKIVRDAIEALTLTHDESGLPFCADLFKFEPQLTPTLSRYLAMIAQENAAAVSQIVTTVVNNSPLTKWQSLWLLHVLEDWGINRSSLLDWMKRFASSSSEVLRAQAVWALAICSDLDRDLWEQVRARTTRLGAPQVAAAVLGIAHCSERERGKLKPTDIFDRRVYEWVEQKCIVAPF